MTVPIALESAERMTSAVAEVLAGEYECGLDGERLTIADIGANVGSFSIWASSRWPGSAITAYEPHPQTFAMLQRNCAAYANIAVVNAALYPTRDRAISLSARYDGDGEAVVSPCAERTFGAPHGQQSFEVPAFHPAKLQPSDVVKIDVEGAEFEILRHLDLGSTSLILLEFQNDANRAAIKNLLAPAFDVSFEDEFPWDPLVRYGYDPGLRGDRYGHLFFVAKTGSKLRPASTPAVLRSRWRSVASAVARKLRLAADR